LEFDQDWLAGVARDATDEEFDGLAAQLMFRQFDRGEAGTENSQPRVVVEADQAKIFGTMQAHFFRSFQQANGH
jgi:hypothetical protein